MIRSRLVRAGLGVLVVALAAPACSSGSAGAEVACEQFVNRRVGAELEHDGPAQGATVEGTGPYVVHSAFVEPATRARTAYTCTVERTDDGWRLVDLSTDR